MKDPKKFQIVVINSFLIVQSWKSWDHVDEEKAIDVSCKYLLQRNRRVVLLLYEVHQDFKDVDDVYDPLDLHELLVLINQYFLPWIFINFPFLVRVLED